MPVGSTISSESAKKIMFEIYRERPHDGPYKVVYFTELGEHERELEIGNAMRGAHVFDGFLLSESRHKGKQTINSLLDRLNQGQALRQAEIEHELSPYLG
jgi:hypothetical protein